MPVYDKPMIFYSLSVLIYSGIKNILLITDFNQQKYFKKILYPVEKKWKLNLQFETQQNPIGGIAESFIIGRNFLNDADKVCMILGDNFVYGCGFPGDLRMILNNKIKRRESFRPFAPSILQEYVSEYFEITDTVPFMEKVFPIREEKRSLIPAVTHADGTGRLQTVNATISPRYYNLINRFREKTGIPLLLNTSFNENEPIVNTPQEALDCYLRTSMDMIVLENCVVQRS
jgi:hypothetical protein